MQSHGHSRAELEKAVKYNGDSSPCLTGLRSVCWKVSGTDPTLHLLNMGIAYEVL